MKKIVVLLLMLAVFSRVHATCRNTLSGRVTDIHTAEPLDGAIVSLTNPKGVLKYSAVTDREGKYLINSICSGDYKIIVTHFDCKHLSISLSIKADVRKNFRLEHHELELKELVVAAKRLNKTISSTETILGKREITEYSQTSLGIALSRIAGVSTFSTGNTIVKPVIHGLHSSRVPVLNNGIRQEDQQWGVEHAPNIDLNAANSLRVIKGAGALEYSGDAIGGVVLVEPKTLTQGNLLQGSVLSSLITNGRGANIAADVEKSFDSGLSLYFQASYKKLGDMSAPKYILSNTGTEERNFSFQSQYQKGLFGIKFFYSFFFNELGILKAAHIGSLDDLLYVINRREPLVHNDFKMSIEAPKQKISHHFSKLTAHYLFTLGKMDLSYAYQFNNRKEFDIRKGDYKELPSMNLDLITQNFKIDFTPDLSPGHTSKQGFLFVLQKNRPVYGTKTRPLIPFYYQYDLGAYWTEAYQMNDRLTFEAGLRADWRKIEAEKIYSFERWRNLGYDKRYPHLVIGELSYSHITKPVLTFWGYAATLGLNYQLTTTTEISANYSLGSRAPNVAELFSDGLHHSAAAVELGDLELKNENSNKFITTLKGELAHRFDFELTAHYNYLKNFINQIPKGVEHNIRGAFPVWVFEQTDAHIFGFDLNLECRISPDWIVRTNLAYLYGQDLKNNLALINMPPVNWESSLEYTNKNWSDFFVKLTYNAVFKQNRYPSVYNFPLELVEEGKKQIRILDITTPPPAYQLVDINTGFSFRLRGESRLLCSLSAQNIFNISQRDYLNRLRYYADNSGRNFILKIQYTF